MFIFENILSVLQRKELPYFLKKKFILDVLAVNFLFVQLFEKKWLHLILQAFVAIGDHDGHVGLGVKCSKEVATAIRGAIILAKLSVIPVRRGYWGNKIGKPHTVPCKVIISSIINKQPIGTGSCKLHSIFS